MAATDAVRRKALAVLREGRVTVLTAKSDPDTLVVQMATVRVQGSRGVYVVDLRGGEWTCTCSRGQAGVRCGHILAAQLVTGHAPNGASEEPRHPETGEVYDPTCGKCVSGVDPQHRYPHTAVAS